jgi:hypothetical protein
MTSRQLAVNEDVTGGEQADGQGNENDLGGIPLSVEHRLPEKASAQSNAVKPTNEDAVIPALYRMGIAFGM